MKIKKYIKGFTIIELLVVISIIGLMSSIVLASLSTAREKGRVAAGQKTQASLHRAYGAEAVAYFEFDGNSLADSLGNGYTLVQPTPPPAPCTFVNDSPTVGGKGFSCSNTSAGMIFTPTNAIDTDAMDDQQSFSIASWYKPTAIQPSGVYGYLAGRRGWHTGPYIVHNSTQLRASVIMAAPTEQVIIIPNPTITLELNKWYFIVLAVDSIGRMATLYLDGRPIPATNSPLWTRALYDYNSSDYFVSGVTLSTTIPYGIVDKVGFYKKALGLAEVQAQYFAQKDSFLASDR